jgi:hypothetical protein
MPGAFSRVNIVSIVPRQSAYRVGLRVAVLSVLAFGVLTIAAQVNAGDRVTLDSDSARVPGDPPSLDLAMKGMRCTGTLTAPRGTTVFLALRKDHGADYNVILNFTIPADAPVRNLPVRFYCQTEREILSNGKAALVQRSNAKIPFPTAFYFKTGVPGAACISLEADADVPVKFDPKWKAGTTVLQRNRVYDLATWLAPKAKPMNPKWPVFNISREATLMVIVADSLAVVSQFVPKANLETNHVFQWQTDVARITKNINETTVQTMPNAPPWARMVLVNNENAWGPPDDYGQFEVKADPSQPIMVRLLVGGKVDSARQVTLKLDHGEGVLTSHVAQADRTMTYTADLETGNRHYPVTYSRTYPCTVAFSTTYLNIDPALDIPDFNKVRGKVVTCPTEYPLSMAVYSKPIVPDGVWYSDGEWTSSYPDFPAFTADKKYIATQFPSVVVEIGLPKD